MYSPVARTATHQLTHFEDATIAEEQLLIALLHFILILTMTIGPVQVLSRWLLRHQTENDTALRVARVHKTVWWI